MLEFLQVAPTFGFYSLCVVLVKQNYLLVQTDTILRAHPLLNKSSLKQGRLLNDTATPLKWFSSYKKKQIRLFNNLKDTEITMLLKRIDFNCPLESNIPEMKSVLFYWFALKENRHVSISSFYGPSFLM